MKVIKSELNTMKTSVGQVFDSEVKDADSIITALNNFINEMGPGTKLTGKAYDAIKVELESFKSIMEKRKTLATSMKTSIDSAIGSMEGYMDGYDELDDSILTEIGNSITSANSTISNSRSSLKNTNLTDDEKKNINGTINSYESILQELEKKKEKLGGLGAADETAWASLSTTINDLSVYNTSMSSNL